MLKISGHFGAFRRLRRPFALQFESAADDSLFCIEQGICRPEQGNFRWNKEFPTVIGAWA